MTPRSSTSNSSGSSGPRSLPGLLLRLPTAAFWGTALAVAGLVGLIHALGGPLPRVLAPKNDTWTYRRAAAAGAPPEEQRIAAIAPERRRYDASLDVNPFLAFSQGSALPALSPWVGFVAPPAQHDYFGFRNHHGTGIYYEKDPGDVIVLTGNSEAAGGWGTTQPTLAVYLEEELARRGLHYRVLDLAVGGYSLSHELGAYIYYGAQIRPRIVIAHTGFVDLVNGGELPRNFALLGQVPHPDELRMEMRAHFLLPFDEGMGMSWTRNPHVSDGDVVAGFLSEARVYDGAVRGNGGHFILGIQRADIARLEASAPKAKEGVLARYEVLRKELPGSELDSVWMYDEARIRTMDHVHTDETNGRIVARIYADKIEPLLRAQGR